MNKAKQMAMFMMLLGGVGAGAYSLYQFSATGTSVPSTAEVYQAIVDMNERQLSMTELDSLVGVVTFVWDDNRTEMGPLYDSLGVWTGANVGGFVNSFTSHGLKGGFAFETENVMSADSNTTSLSISEIRALVARGNFDVGTVGWDETSGLYNGNYSLLAQGYSNPDTFYTNIMNAVKSQRDTLGLGAPRWISHSNSSGARVTIMAARRAGILYGFGPQGSATGPSNDSRPFMPYQYEAAQWGAWGTGGAGGGDVACGPGQVLDRYNISQCTNEAATLATWKKSLDRAAQVHGLVVFIGHRPDLIGAAVAAELGMPTTGDAWAVAAFDSFCSWIKVRYIDTGLIVAMTPGEAGDHFFKRPIGPTANFALGKSNFGDIDGDGHLDGWSEGFGLAAAADTALIKPSAFTGHNGGPAYTLNWAANALGSTQSILGQGTPDSAWTDTGAILGVYPPAGSGWKVHFEFWAAVDSFVGWKNVGTAASPTTPGNMYVGAMVYSLREMYPYRWGTTGIGHYSSVWGTNQNYAYDAGWNALLGSAEPVGNRFRFVRNNCIDRASFKWMHVIIEADVKPYADYVLLALYKHKALVANEVIISDYSVTFYRRDGEVPITN